MGLHSLVMINKFLLAGLVALGLWSGGVSAVSAQAVHQEFQELVKGEVIEIVSESPFEVTGTETVVMVQEIRVLLKEGKRAGEVVRMESDAISLRVGDEVFVNRLVAIDGVEHFSVRELERRGPLALLVLLFAGLVIWLSGWQGVRALSSLAVSFGAILFLLVPAIVNGYPPILSSILIAGLVLSINLFFTHGFKPRVVAAFLGTFGAAIFAGILAWTWTTWMRFTGLVDDISVYLNLSTVGTIDLPSLLLGGIIIGLLGVLDDVSITQSSVVQELKRANSSFGFVDLYQRALKVGRDHVGSLVNTLAFAYAGTALPLLILFSFSTSPLFVIVNQEIIAAEIVRIMVGSIGLVMAVPLTTALAAWYFKNHTPSDKDVYHDHHHGHDHDDDDHHHHDHDDDHDHQVDRRHKN